MGEIATTAYADREIQPVVSSKATTNRLNQSRNSTDMSEYHLFF
jgi:hypothetical protein